MSLLFTCFVAASVLLSMAMSVNSACPEKPAFPKKNKPATFQGTYRYIKKTSPHYHSGLKGYIINPDRIKLSAKKDACPVGSTPQRCTSGTNCYFRYPCIQEATAAEQQTKCFRHVEQHHPHTSRPHTKSTTSAISTSSSSSRSSSSSSSSSSTSSSTSIHGGWVLGQSEVNCNATCDNVGGGRVCQVNSMNAVNTTAKANYVASLLGLVGAVNEDPSPLPAAPGFYMGSAFPVSNSVSTCVATYTGTQRFCCCAPTASCPTSAAGA